MGINCKDTVLLIYLLLLFLAAYKDRDCRAVIYIVIAEKCMVHVLSLALAFAEANFVLDVSRGFLYICAYSLMDRLAMNSLTRIISKIYLVLGVYHFIIISQFTFIDLFPEKETMINSINGLYSPIIFSTNFIVTALIIIGLKKNCRICKRRIQPEWRDDRGGKV